MDYFGFFTLNRMVGERQVQPKRESHPHGHLHSPNANRFARDTTVGISRCPECRALVSHIPRDGFPCLACRVEMGLPFERVAVDGEV